MAYRIAREVGMPVSGPLDVWKYFGVLAVVSATILWLFRHLLGGAFSLFSLVGWLPATALAEFSVTCLVGVLFWTAFAEARAGRPFRVPCRMAGFVMREFRALAMHQWGAIRRLFTRENLARAGRGLRDYFTGAVAERSARHEEVAIAAAAMTRLLTRDAAELITEPDERFLASIRDLYPDLRDASVEEIADHFRAYDDRQMAGVLNQIKGRWFEHAFVEMENTDGDAITARLHDDPYHPGSDAVLTDMETGDEWEVSLKSTNSVAYVQSALARYPEIPIVTTAEHSEGLAADPRIDATDISNATVTRVTSENFDRLLHEAESPAPSLLGRMTTAAAFSTLVWLWPFVVAYARKRIRKEQLSAAFRRRLGESGGRLALRLAGLITLGPIFAWYLLARAVYSISNRAQESSGAPPCGVGGEGLEPPTSSV